MSPIEAARIIHEAGGISVLAHPAEIENLSYVEEILQSGAMDGIEVYHHPFCGKTPNTIGLLSQKNIISSSAAAATYMAIRGGFPCT